MERVPEPFDPPLGLGGAGSDVGDPELVQRRAELGKSDLFAGQFVFEGKLVRLGRKKDSVAVTVPAVGDAVVGHHLPEHLQMALGILLFAKVERQHLTGGIIDGAVEVQIGTAVLQPGVGAGIILDQESERGLPVPGPAAASGAFTLWVLNPGCGQEAAD